MQLSRKQRVRIRRTLRAASCALLGSMGSAYADQGDWTVDSGILYYGEQDRVTAIEPVVLAKRDFGGETFLTTRLVADTLTGATPTGAMPSSMAQSVSSPSGGSQVSIQPGTNPLDNSFEDFRAAVSSTWSQPLSRLWRLDVGASYSEEHDFRSVGVNTLLARDFNKRNTTVSLGLGYESDSIFPLGGVHVPLSQVPVPPPAPPGGEDEGEHEGGGGSVPLGEIQSATDTKQVTDVLFGVTQVVNRYWIAQLNYTYSLSTGYQNDPYKVVSVLNTDPNAAPIPVGEPLYNIYENRPDSRKRNAIYFGNKAYIGGDVVDLSYRHGWDDWGIRSDTVELRYRLSLGNGTFLQPHLRWYRQTPADFYHRGLLDTDPVPAVVSADYRLAGLNARTVGLEWGTTRQGRNRFALRIERYIQSGQKDPYVDIGVQQGFDAFPDLKAVILQVSYDF